MQSLTLAQIWVVAQTYIVVMMPDLLLPVALSVAALLLLLAFLYSTSKSKKSTTIPGLEPSDPQLGNLGDVGAAGSLHQFLQGLHASFGPIASFYWGPQLAVSIASPELFKQHSKAFNRPVDVYLLFEPLITLNSLQYANGEDARERRKLYDTIFSHTSMIKYYDIVEQNTLEMVSHLLATERPGTLVPLGEHMMTFAIQAISKIAYGDYFDGDQTKQLVHSYHACWDELESRLGGDVPPPDDPRHAMLIRERNIMYDLIREALEYRKRNPGGTGEVQLLDVLLESDKPEEVMLADALTYLIGGTHTTGILLTWIIYYLCTHRDVEDKLLQELKVVLKGKGISPSNRPDLVYMKQVIDESLRCSCLAPFAARYEDVDSQLGGHFIPAKTPVIQALGVMLGDEKYWPDPDKFDPDRFKDRPRNFAFEPFGFAGKRKCPAYNFTYIEVMTVLAVMLPKVKFTLKAGQIVTKTHGLVTSPTEEIWVTAEARD